MPKRKDWKSLLLQQAKKDNAIILSDLVEKIGEKTRIYFECNCKNKFNNGFIMIIKNLL